MSQRPISHSPDLRRLQDEGYDIAIIAGHLLLRQVPYVDESGRVEYGTLVSTLDLAGEVTTVPGTHVVTFQGGTPCDKDGNPLTKIINSSRRKDLGNGLVIDHTFSSKPEGGYLDYYAKMTTYAGILSGPAQAIDPSATARNFPVIQSKDLDPVFHYVDTASSRAGIAKVTEKLACHAVAIVGLGGTGSYILDLVAKTPVQEIHLFDGDQFLQHNAFRSPGAPSIEVLEGHPLKSEYFAGIYSRMRRNLVPHGYLDEANANCLRDMDFVFVAVDKGDIRKIASEKLQEFGIPFVDVGMGILEIDGALLGQLRVTTSNPGKPIHVQNASALPDVGAEDHYTTNIQIADLNALNAALAVIKWKKSRGFYIDLEAEHETLYQIDGNCLINCGDS